MHPETKEIITLIETCKPLGHIFTWNPQKEGDFNIWNLLISERFVWPSDLERAITTWKNIERRGTPSYYKEYPGYSYAPPRGERKNSSWNPYLQAKRYKYYNALAYFIKKNLQSLEVYSLATPSHCQGIVTPGQFHIDIIVGQTLERDWICVAPVAPDQLGYIPLGDSNLAAIASCKSSKAVTKDVFQKINQILAMLPPIKIYGYYEGGYNYSYKHQLFCAASSDKVRAIELSLRGSQALDVRRYFPIHDLLEESSKVKKVMRARLRRRKCYRIVFWDLGYEYAVGCTESGSWIGLKYQLEFEYNP